MFTDPVKNLKAFALREDNIVGDLGAGTGYYAVEAGKMVPRGKVYAVEVVKEYLTTIKNKVREAKLSNVECLWGNVEEIGGTKIADNVLDAVIASNVLFQVEDKNKFIEEIKRILKPHGRVLLVDWTPNSPTLSSIKVKTAVPKEIAQELFTRAGFSLERNIDAGVHHYGMILDKN